MSPISINLVKHVELGFEGLLMFMDGFDLHHFINLEHSVELSGGLSFPALAVTIGINNLFACFDKLGVVNTLWRWVLEAVQQG